MTYDVPNDEDSGDIPDDPSPHDEAIDEADDAFDDGSSGDEEHPVARRKPRGTYLGAAMMGLQEAMFGKVKEETVIEVEASGDPPNIDLDGLDTPFGADGRLVGPPLDQIKARATRRRRKR